MQHIATLTAAIFLLAGAGSDSAQATGPTALDVGPADAPMVFAVTGLAAIENQLDSFVEHLGRVGLDDPGMGRLRELAREQIPHLKRSSGHVLHGLGLAPEGSLAAYAVPGASGVHGVVAVDVANRQAFLKTLAWLKQVGASGAAKGKRPRVKIKRQRLPGGGLKARLHTAEGEDLVVKFHGDVAVVSDEEEALELMRLGGGAPLEDLARLRPSPEHVGMLMDLDIAAFARAERGTGLASDVVKTLRVTASAGPDGLRSWGKVTWGSQVAPFLGLFVPSAAGVRARAVMADMADGTSEAWLRWSFDLQAGHTLLRDMVGPAFGDAMDEFHRESGVHMVRDVFTVYTGDLLISCHDGFPNCVVAVGVQDAALAADSMAKVLAAVGKEGGADLVETRAGESLPKGAVPHMTTFSSVDIEGEDVIKESLFTVHWGVRPHVLVVGLTDSSVAGALQRSGGAKVTRPDLIVDRGFGSADAMSSYQLIRDTSQLIRQLMPVLRGLLPADSDPGMVARVVDAFIAAQDLTVDGASLLVAEGDSWIFESHMRLLPSEGQPGHDPAMQARFEEALRARYQADIGRSNELLLAIAQDAEGTLWARKAKAYALESDDMGGMAMGMWLGMAVPWIIDEMGLSGLMHMLDLPGSGSGASP